MFYYRSSTPASVVYSLLADFDILFDNEDRCFIAFSYVNSLDVLRLKYYDAIDKYDRLLHIKHQVDPDRIFSPNEFCIGGIRTS